MHTNNFLYAYITKGKYDELFQLLLKIENSPIRNQHEEGIVFQKVTMYRLMYHLNTGNIQGINNLTKNINQGLSRYSINKNNRLK